MLNDYLLWHLLYKVLPHRLIDLIFTVYTAIQLYILGAIYVVKEINRKFSSSVRKLGPNEPDIPNDCTNLVAIVTGGSRGIGLSVAKDLYDRGATVIVTSSSNSEEERDKLAQLIRTNVDKEEDEQCRRRRRMIRSSHSQHHRQHNGTVHVWEIDFRRLSSVCDFVSRFNRHYDSLDLLINNAGVMFVNKSYTIDGFESHYQINYLSHALLTWLLMPALDRSKTNSNSGNGGGGGARVVNVSSSTHYPRCLFIDDLQSLETPYSPFHAYAQSKLCQVMLTYYISDWLNGVANDHDRTRKRFRVLVNTLHPGVAKTGLYQHVWWVKIFPRIARLLFRTAEEGAETVIYVGLSNEVNTGGYYYEDCSPLRSSSFSLDKSIQKRLAELTRHQLSGVIDEYNRHNPQHKVTQMFEC